MLFCLTLGGHFITDAVLCLRLNYGTGWKFLNLFIDCILNSHASTCHNRFSAIVAYT